MNSLSSLNLNSLQIRSLYDQIHSSKKSVVRFSNIHTIDIHSEGIEKHFRMCFKDSKTHIFVKFKNGDISVFIAACTYANFPRFTRYNLIGDKFQCVTDNFMFGGTRNLINKIDFYATLRNQNDFSQIRHYRNKKHSRGKRDLQIYRRPTNELKREVVLRRVNKLIKKINLSEFSDSIIDSIRDGDFDMVVKKANLAREIRSTQFTEYYLFSKYAKGISLYGTHEFSKEFEIRAICKQILNNIVQEMFDIMYKDLIDKLVSD